MAVEADNKCSLSFVLLAATFLACVGCSTKEYTDIKTAIVASKNIPRRLDKINGRYVLGATDGIRVEVANSPELSGQHQIRPDGYITLKLVGDVYVEGMTPMQAGATLMKALRVYIREAEVTVTVTGFNSKKYYMFGETPGTGAHIFDGDVTVLRAFGRARGVTTRAAWDRIVLVRATATTRQVFKINLADIVKDGRWETNVQLKANDIVYVPPTHLARVGYVVNSILFPITSAFRLTNVAGSGP